MGVLDENLFLKAQIPFTDDGSGPFLEGRIRELMPVGGRAVDADEHVAGLYLS